VLALVLIALTSKFPAKVTYARVVLDSAQIASISRRGEFRTGKNQKKTAYQANDVTITEG
jgi:hypothetical protein